MPDNTTGPVRDDRTKKPTFKPPVAEPAAVGEKTGQQRRPDRPQARTEPTQARTEPVTEQMPEPLPAAPPRTTPANGAAPEPGGAVKEQAPGRAAVKEQTSDGAAVKEQAPDRAAPGEQLDAKPVPAHTAADSAQVKPAGRDDDTGAVLFGADTATVFRTRWREVQADFVDDPARAVRGADELVDEVLKQLSETLAKHKLGLEGGWQDRGETEELRVALRKYRSFFDQLLKT